MELQQVRYFLALCEERNFTRAARRCGVTQPSLTRAIKILETKFGAALFDRGRTVSSLSDLGKVVRPHFIRLDRHARDAERRAEEFLSQMTAATRSPNTRGILRRRRNCGSPRAGRAGMTRAGRLI